MGGIVSSIFGGGGGGGGGSSSPAPTSQNQTVSSISPWAQPGVSAIIAQQMANQFPNQTVNADGTINLGQQAGYTSFGQNGAGIGPNQMAAANAAVAGFSPLQQQAQQYAAGLQEPGQFANATNMATAAGQGLYGTANTANQYGSLGAGYGQSGANIGTQGGLGYGAMGAGIGQQAANQTGNALGYGAMGAQAGASYGQNATNPNAVQAYMNPYLQATLNPAMQLQNQQFGMVNAQNQGQATQQGAFGGGRQAVTQGLNQQNQMLAQNQLVGNAYNQAYNTANQNMQNAASLGMQGAGVGLQGMNAANSLYQTGIQGANTGLQGVNTALQGTAQGMQGAQIGLQGVNAAQAGYTGAGQQAANLGNLGTQQLAADTSIINTQNSLGAQQQANQQSVINQAMQNYANSQNYPMQQAYNLEGLYTGVPTASTQTNYSAAPSTASTLMGAGTAMYGASQLAKVAKGGIIKTKKMASGGIASGVPAQKLDYMLGSLPDQQLAQKTQPPTDPQTIQAALSQQAFRQQMRAPGIGAAPAGQTSFNAASGGIVAFGAGGDAGQTQDMEDAEGGVSGQTTVPQQTDLAKYTQPFEQYLGKNTAGADYLKTLQGLRGTPEQADKQDAWRMIQAGIGMVGRSPFWQENIKGANPAIEGHMADVKERKADEMAFAKAQFDVGNMDYNEKVSLLKLGQTDKAAFEKMAHERNMKTEELANALTIAIGHDKTTLAAGNKVTAKTDESTKIYYENMLRGLPEKAYTPAELAQFKAQARTQALQDEKPYSGAGVAQAINTAEKADPILLDLRMQLVGTANETEKKDILSKIDARNKVLATQVQQNAARPNAGGAPAPNTSGSAGPNAGPSVMNGPPGGTFTGYVPGTTRPVYKMPDGTMVVPQ